MVINDDQHEEDVSFSSADGVAVKGTYRGTLDASIGPALLVHGLTEDRNEAFGFYKKLASRLSASGFSSLRFDLRGHGSSELDYDELSLFNALTDIDAAVNFLIARSGYQNVHLIGTSFGGGLAVLYAARAHSSLCSLVLLCPNLDYRVNWLERKPFWSDGGLTSEGARTLRDSGALPHGEFRIGRCMFHELLNVRPFEWMSGIPVPCLTVHGTTDSIVPDDLSVRYYRCNERSELLRIEGADHGFAEPSDEDFSSAVTAANVDRVFSAVVAWLARHNNRRADIA